MIIITMTFTQHCINVNITLGQRLFMFLMFMNFPLCNYVKLNSWTKIGYCELHLSS